ncbi:MAG: efflux RND transporter periplasmic adaptor subunit [Oscillospiraceae bacterium]|nr:efflux RND transporter periplasmic adaptor subunit [Oscillospiraceae bacterium]
MKKHLIPLLVALCLLALSACGSNSKTEPTELPAGVAVQVSTVERRDVATENRVTGSVTSDDETSIYVASTAKCTAVYCEAGDAVEKGDVICTIDLGSTQASYNAAKISYDSAASSYSQQQEVFDQQLVMQDKQIALYEKTLADTKELFEIGAASQLEIDQAELALEGAKLQRASIVAQRDSTLAQLRAGMESYRSNLEQLNVVMDNVDARGNVVAPASGTLASLTAVEGSFVSANYPVAVISGAEQMKVTVYVSETLVPKLSIGDTTHVSISSAGAEFAGVIRSIEQTANMQTKLYAVVISVPSDIEGLVSGMFATATFFTETSAGALAVPSEAILTSNGEQYVFVVSGDKAVRTPVTTGLTGNGVTSVLDGLSAGEQLVVVGQQYLNDGDAVRIVGG